MCANIVTIDIAPPRLLVSRQTGLYSHCLQTFEFHDSIRTGLYTTDLFYRLSGGSHHFQLDFLLQARVVRRFAKAHSSKATAADELLQRVVRPLIWKRRTFEVAIPTINTMTPLPKRPRILDPHNKGRRNISKSDALHHIGMKWRI